MPSLDDQDVNAFINFVLYATYGKMAEADDLMRRFGEGVQRVTHKMPRVHRGPLYRGVLMDPAKRMTPDARYTFVSWTDDIDVACWFASPEATVSQPLAETNPALRGYVLTMNERDVTTRILFHHAWSMLDWPKLALRHPHMGEEGARQIAWAWHSQREVITTPPTEFPMPVPVELLYDARGTSALELDRRFAPPWIQR